MTFVDTSALLAVLDGQDQNHAAAAQVWRELVQADEHLLTTKYVIVETCALVQRRLGLNAVRPFLDDMVPLLDVEWIEAVAHATGVAALLMAARRQLSLVDCVSFETMRRLGVNTAFTFDKHFSEQGFDCLPERVGATQS